MTTIFPARFHPERSNGLLDDDRIDHAHHPGHRGRHLRLHHHRVHHHLTEHGVEEGHLAVEIVKLIQLASKVFYNL